MTTSSTTTAPAPVKKHALFGSTATWTAGAPPVMASVGTSAEAAVSRPTTAEEWLSLGWSIPFEGVAWVATAAADGAEAITEREAYLQGLTLDSKTNAALWMLLAADMAASEAQLSDERRRELDDDNAPDLLWTVTVPGVGQRLYADACYLRSLTIDSKSQAAAIAWAHLWEYLQRVHSILEFEGEYITANDCLRRALKFDAKSSIVMRTLSNYLALNKLPGATSEGSSWSRLDAAFDTIAGGFVTDPKIWTRLAIYVLEEHDSVSVAKRPLSLNINDVTYSMVTLAARAVELDPTNQDAWYIIARSAEPQWRLPPSHYYVAKDGRLADNSITACVLAVENTEDKEGDILYLLCKAMAQTRVREVGIKDRTWTFDECVNECLRRDPDTLRLLADLAFNADLPTLNIEGRGAMSHLELAVAAVEASPTNGAQWAALGALLRRNEMYEPGLSSVTISGVEYNTLEVLERAITLDPRLPGAWHDYALIDSIPGDVYVLPSGTVATPHSVAVSLVTLHTGRYITWYWLGRQLVASKQPTALVTMEEMSAYDCFVHALLREPTSPSSWRDIAHLSTRDPLKVGEETVTKTECYRRALVHSGADDSLAWAWLGDHLSSQPYESRVLTDGGKDYDQRACWLKAISTAHPELQCRGLAAGLLGLGLDMDENDTIEVTLRMPSSAADLMVEAKRTATETLTLSRRELLERSVDVALNRGSRQDKFLSRPLVGKARAALDPSSPPAS